MTLYFSVLNERDDLFYHYANLSQYIRNDLRISKVFLTSV